MKQSHEQIIDELHAIESAPIAPSYCTTASRAIEVIKELTADVERLAATMLVTALAEEEKPDWASELDD
jgi:ABC-type sulfate transport system substrate-binding protein